MAHHTKTWSLDNTAYVNVVSDTYCDIVTCYENARAATTDLYVKGKTHWSQELQKLAGEKVVFARGGYSAGETVGSMKCVSAGAITIAQEEDNFPIV